MDSLLRNLKSGHARRYHEVVCDFTRDEALGAAFPDDADLELEDHGEVREGDARWPPPGNISRD